MFSGHENDDGQRLFEWYLRELGARDEAIRLAQQRWASETFRSYRRSLQRFAEHIAGKGFPQEKLLSKPDALAEVGNFIAEAQRGSRWSEATLRVMKGQLKQIFRMGKGTGGEELLDLVARGLDRSAPRAKPHYDDMWEIDDLIDMIRKSFGVNTRLSDAELQTKAMILLMIYSACRLAEISRVTPPDTQPEKDSFVAHTIMKQKQAFIQPLRVYALPDWKVCPVRALKAWSVRRQRLHPPQHVFFFNLRTHRHVKQTAVSTAFRAWMTRAKVPDRFKGYSVKHAVITKLFRLGVPEEQIISFGRWKAGSSVPRTYYYIAATKREWPGGKILAPAPWTEQAKGTSEKDANPRSSEPRTPDAAEP
jgi:site-specific recombinase XerD